MGLFLMDHSKERIMILGRWKSDSYMVYIRPQVIEWTNNMSSDMIQHDSYFDASGFDKADPEVPRIPTRPTFNGPNNALYLYH